jgi:hypothetical protein
MKIEQNGKIIVTSSGELHPVDQGKYKLKIAHNQWLSVRDDIFDSSNWQEENVFE